MSDDENDEYQFDDEYRNENPPETDGFRSRLSGPIGRIVGNAAAMMVICLLAAGYVTYTQFRIDVPAKNFAVLTKKVGTDLENGQEVAPDENHKGLQLTVLTEGRHFYNPYSWDWEVYPMVEIPQEKMGVRVRLYGDDLPYGHFVATNDVEKGIVKDVLKPGRYALNAKTIDGKTKDTVGVSRAKGDYVEIIELWEPTVIPAGHKGVVTNLAGPMPDDPNVLLVEADRRGPQPETLDAGTYYLNPYMYRINAVDCRSQRLNLSGPGNEMGFPSKDGFWISLDGIIEFKVKPEKAAEVYVTYNDVNNDGPETSSIADEIKEKVIMPNARAFCRLRGSNASGRDFIGGITRSAFQAAFQKSIRETCDEQGIEIVQALITDVQPPDAIRDPVQQREIAKQELKQYDQQTLQQHQEALLATEKAKVEQRQRLVDSKREVVTLTTDAGRRQDVALAEANRDKEVAEKQLEAARDKAEAIVARNRAEAAVIVFENEATAAGWKKSVQALDNDGNAFARYVLYQKLAPGYRSIMTNTADSPLMEVFNNFAGPRIPQVADQSPRKPPERTAPVTAEAAKIAAEPADAAPVAANPEPDVAGVPSDAGPVESEPVEVEPDTAPVDAAPVEAGPVEAEAVPVETDDASPNTAEPASEPTETADVE